ncbi:MAG: hypothetical protein BroJett040_08390 [Oligoflexia bacterium]|nr:MAG: hypothetical protein BroJett040_08390 [Oligoflexia bacterium]
MLSSYENLNVNKSPRNFGQSGFSLIEVMIVIGIVAIIGAGLTTMLVNANKSAMRTERTGDFNSMVNTLQGVFNNTSSCITSFGGSGAATLSPSVSESSPQPVTLNIGGTTIQAGAKYGNALNITKFEFTGKTPAGGTDQWVVPLKLSVDRIIGNEAAPIGHTFNLILTVDSSNKIVGCSGQYNDFWVATSIPTDITYMGGKVGVGTETPAYELDVNGSVQGKMFLYNSDIRLKENIREIPNVLDRALKLHGVLYDWKNKSPSSKGTDQLGLIAQEVEKVFPEAVVTNPTTGLKTVQYGNLVAPLIEAIKEQQIVIEKQSQEIREIQKLLLKNQIH